MDAAPKYEITQSIAVLDEELSALKSALEELA